MATKSSLSAAILVIATAPLAHADNSITIESRSFLTGQVACSLGIWLSNDVHITALVMPIEARALSGEAFYLSGNPLTRPNIQPGRRLDRSPLGSADPNGGWPAASPINNRFPSPGGYCSPPTALPTHTYQVPASAVDAIPPDGFMFETHSTGDNGPPAYDSIALQPGTDYPTRDSASWVFVFNANNEVGCFEIDTCCVTPSGRLGCVNLNTQFIGMEFTKGIACIDADPNMNFPPVVTCPPIVWQSQDPESGGAYVTFTVDVSDEDPTLEAVCTPPSGSFFSLGATTVTCIATDTAGLADTCTFDVVVHTGQDNSIVIESRDFLIGQPACTLGIWLSNDVPITALVMAIDARTESGGAFYLSGNSLTRPNAQPGRRLDNSPLGSADPGGKWPAASPICNKYPVPGGFCSPPMADHTYQTPAAAVDAISPDGWLYESHSTGGPDDQVALSPGADYPSRDSASWVFIFDANNELGCFEIDTACVTPSGRTGCVDLNTEFREFSFTKGRICIVACICDCFGNPATPSSPEINVLDIVYATNVAFRNSSPIPDTNPTCSTYTTDVDCSGATTVIDLVKMIAVVFRNGNPATEFCDPCP